jgi:soluble lytic murein transglycosylase-like protein
MFEWFAAMAPDFCPTASGRRNNWVPQIVNAQVAPAEIFSMKLFPSLAWLTAVAALLFSAHAEAQQRAQFESLVATHARANNVPEALVHRVIVRESRYRPELVGRGGTIGLMQIKLATARGLGYTGDAAGLRDPDTNLTYGVKYLAGAWRAANSDHARAVRYYAGGYYYVAKRQRQARTRLPVPVLASAPPTEAVKPAEAASEKALLAPK